MGVSDPQNINVIDRCIPIISIPRSTWNQSDTEAFMERLWAYKRINYLLDNPALSDPTKPHCEEGIDEAVEENNASNDDDDYNYEDESSEYQAEYDDNLEFPDGTDRCEKEAIRLALKYNFVTDVTSMVVEENDEYITKKNLEEKKVQPRDVNQYSYISHRSSANIPQSNSISYSYNPVGSMVNKVSANIIPRMGTTSRTPIPSVQYQPPPQQAQNSLTHSMDWDNYADYYDPNFDEMEEDYRVQVSPTTQRTTTTTTQSPPLGLCKITLFSSTHFRGASKILNFNAATLGNFADELASLKIEGNCCWTLFTEENFGGESQTLNGPREYASPTQIKEVYKRAKSAKQHRC